MLRKLILLVFITTTAIVHASGQTEIFNGINISIKFPKKLWDEYATMKAESPEDPLNRIYRRTDFISDSLSVYTSLNIIIEEIPAGTSLFDYTTEKRKDLTIKVTTIYNQKTLGSKYKEITGFRGISTEEKSSVYYLIYLVKENKGMSIMIHLNALPPEKLEKEIFKIIKSIKSTDS